MICNTSTYLRYSKANPVIDDQSFVQVSQPGVKCICITHYHIFGFPKFTAFNERIVLTQRNWIFVIFIFVFCIGVPKRQPRGQNQRADRNLFVFHPKRLTFFIARQAHACLNPSLGELHVLSATACMHVPRSPEITSEGRFEDQEEAAFHDVSKTLNLFV